MEFKIDKDFHDTRLDKFIRKKYEGVNLGEIFKLIRKGNIKVNGKKQKQNYRLQEGDIVKVYYQTEGLSKKKEFIDLSENEKSSIKKTIVYEDDRVLILNKKPNIVMHKGSGHSYGLSEMLKSYTQNMNFTFVNRIDKATSGLIIGAKDLITVRELSEEIKNRNVGKYYYILVDGLAKQDEFQIVSYLKKTEERVVELDSYEEGSKESISYFSVVRRGEKRCILEAELGTGRTHQLRVQLAERGLPIHGDMKYGNKNSDAMHLFSHRVVIEKYGIDVNLDIPDYFLENL